MKKYQSPFITRQYMMEKDFEIYYYDDLHFSNVNSHSHDYYEFYFYLEGDMSMVIDGQAYPLKKGDVFLIPPGISHHLINHNDEVPYRRFIFWLSKDFYEVLKNASNEYAYIVEHALTNDFFIYHNDIIAFNSIQGKLFRLIEEIHSNRFGRDTKILLCVNDLMLHLSRMAYETHHPTHSKHQQSLYDNMIQYIEDHLEDDLSLDQLASVFFVSKYHIAHVFKDNLGLSVHQYITKKRLAMCRNAILSDTNISKTFQTYGFKDYSSFFRAFKKEYGLSPKEYKDIHGIQLNQE